MSTLNHELKKLFAEYESAFDALDFERIGELYTDAFMSAFFEEERDWR